MARSSKRPANKRRSKAAQPERCAARPPGLRIVGGEFRGRKLEYPGDERTRPMKDRVREAVFNLVGPDVKGRHAVDLFAGTGALGLEALSRGAARATFIERHFPTAAVIRRNIEALEVGDRSTIVAADVFYWSRQPIDEGAEPWIVFCSPPFDLWIERAGDMLALVERMIDVAPAGSTLVVEADTRFDFKQLPEAEQWDVRPYPPAVVGLLRAKGTR